ncbi:MAG: hypothetical protein RMJ44_10485 [Cytophagales bacterium]|nr:hypothetical protein [Bernardetiaceae bacterium]MDW8211502.1 hypothetical protein [Cytophagales bacterium]
MNLDFAKLEKVTMYDKAFAYELLGMYIGELKEYLQQIKAIVYARDLKNYRFLNHKIRSMLNTLEAEFLLSAQVNLQNLLLKEASAEELQTSLENLMELGEHLSNLLETRRQYYAGLIDQPA